MLKAVVVAVQVLPLGGQFSVTGEPGAAMQLLLVLTLALGPETWKTND